jgi:hypothetical protein
MAVLRKDALDISSNARLKLYPVSTVLQVANDDIFRQSGWEASGGPRRRYSVPKKGQAKNPERSLESSMHRAKAAVRDIALCNHFTHFFTGTLSPKKVDRYDTDAVYQKVSNFLRNSVHRKGFQYVIVPEHHKDGAIHFHGLCSLGTMKIVRGTDPHGNPLSTDSGQPKYNLVDWRLGYSTCIPIDEHYERTCNYLTKYITKDGAKIFGKWYLSSRNIQKRPDIVLLERMDYNSFCTENQDALVVPLYRDVCICQKQISRE